MVSSTRTPSASQLMELQAAVPLTTSRWTSISSWDSVAAVLVPASDFAWVLFLRSELRATLLWLEVSFGEAALEVWFLLKLCDSPLPERFVEARARVVIRTLRPGRVPTMTARIVHVSYCVFRVLIQQHSQIDAANVDQISNRLRSTNPDFSRLWLARMLANTIMTRPKLKIQTSPIFCRNDTLML